MFRLHHVNITTHDVPELNEFYKKALPLEQLPLPKLHPGASGVGVSFLSAGDPEWLQVHIASQQVDLGRKLGHYVNPVERGHIAFRCDEIGAIMARLETAGVHYSDYGEWAVPGWHQIYFKDPLGNVIEVQQKLRD